MDRLRIAVIGATGLVGQELLGLLAEGTIPYESLYLVASPDSQGHTLTVKGQSYRIMSPEEALVRRPQIAFFSAGRQFATEWAPRFIQTNGYLVDNSPAWRMSQSVPLVVPEINAHLIQPTTRLIANPNCAAVQLALALYPLHRAYGLRRLVVSTYQSVSGAGKEAMRCLQAERSGDQTSKTTPALDLNIIPQIGPINEKGLSEEEVKIQQELNKLLLLSEVPIVPTCVRVPVLRGHAESVYAVFEKDVQMDEVCSLLGAQSGVRVLDDIEPLTPRLVETRNEVFVSRLRVDPASAKAIHLWVVADNLRKGAAWNAYQIMQHIYERRITEQAKAPCAEAEPLSDR